MKRIASSVAVLALTTAGAFATEPTNHVQDMIDQSGLADIQAGVVSGGLILLAIAAVWGGVHIAQRLMARGSRAN